MKKMICLLVAIPLLMFSLPAFSLDTLTFDAPEWSVTYSGHDAWGDRIEAGDGDEAANKETDNILFKPLLNAEPIGGGSSSGIILVERKGIIHDGSETPSLIMASVADLALTGILNPPDI